MARTDPRPFSDPFFWQGNDTTIIARNRAFGQSSGDCVVVERDAVGQCGPRGKTGVPSDPFTDGLFDEPAYAGLAGGRYGQPGFAELSDGSFVLAFAAAAILGDDDFRSDLAGRSLLT